MQSNTGRHKKADEDKASKTRADLNTLKSGPRVGPEKSNIRKNPYFMKNSSRFKSDGKKPVEQRPIVELRKIEGKLATALTHLRRKFKKWSNFHETSYTLPKGWGKNTHDFFFFVSSVVSEIWVVALMQMPAHMGTKLAHL